MGLFGKKKIDPPRRGPEPIVADSAVLAQARHLLADFERSQTTRGTDEQTRAAVLAIARAGSLPGSPTWAPTDQAFMVAIGRHYAEHGDLGTERPWRWLAAVARSAADRGEYDLVARVALFATHWASVISPQLAASDEMELRLPKGVPDDSLGEILSTALRVLPGLAPTDVVVADPVEPRNSVNVGTVLVLCAREAKKDPSVLAPDVRDVAARLLPA